MTVVTMRKYVVKTSFNQLWKKNSISYNFWWEWWWKLFVRKKFVFVIVIFSIYFLWCFYFLYSVVMFNFVPYPIRGIRIFKFLQTQAALKRTGYKSTFCSTARLRITFWINLNLSLYDVVFLCSTDRPIWIVFKKQVNVMQISKYYPNLT